MPSTWTVRATGGPHAIDLDEVRRSLEILVDPDHWVELRALPSGKSRVVKGSDLDGLCKAAEELSDNRNLYYGINPVLSQNTHGSMGGATKDDIAKRRWFLFDVDPIKTSVDESATKEEKEAARVVAENLMGHLADADWPAPVFVDSGNGWHLLYRVDLPNDAHAHALMKTALYKLADKFDTDRAKVDRSVHSTARIAKLPGTWARKGDPTKERPHRPCRMMHAPEVPGVVTAEQLQAITQEVKPPDHFPEYTNGTFKVQARSDYSAYAKAALDREVARVKFAIPGPKEGRNNALNRAGYSMGQCVGAGWILKQEVLSSLRMAAIIAGLPEEDFEDTLTRAVRDGEKEPRKPPKTKQEPPPIEIPAGECIIIRASAITPRQVEWIWPGRIPLGKLTTFAGQGGLGKTFVLCDITARITRGDAWPDLAGECTEPGQVLFISGEDDLDDTIVPRLIELGADLSKVVFLKTEYQDQFKLKDLPTLDRALAQAGPNMRFVAIDPPTAYLGDVDDHKNAELRQLLAPLKNWASRHRVAMVFNTHVNKPQGAKVEAMMRVMGSVAWVNAVRAAHMFAKDPSDLDRRLFCGMKLNIGKEKKGLAYKIVSTETLAKVEWGGEVDTTADEAVNRDHRRPKRRVVASEWLEEQFEGIEEIASKQIYGRKNEQTTISDDAIREAKEDMGIKAYQRVDPDGGKIWVWFWSTGAREKWEVNKRMNPQAEADEYVT